MRSITIVSLGLAAMMTGCASPRPDAFSRTGDRRADVPLEHPEEARVLVDPQVLTVIADAYYPSSCPMCAGHLGVRGETVDIVYGDRNLRFCCSECRAGYEADPAAQLARIDRMLIDDQRPHYTISTSIVSGRQLGDHPIEFVWGNRLFRVCDETERGAVLDDPVQAIKALDQAIIESQLPTYAMLTKCPVQGDILASDVPIDIVVANRMIRVCCGRCVRVVKSRPSQYLGMVEYANREAASHSK